MATFLALTNSVLARLNEVQLTASNFSATRGIQTQAQNAVNESIRYINQESLIIRLITQQKQKHLHRVQLDILYPQMQRQ